MTYLSTLPIVILSKLMKKLARISPKAIVIAEPIIGKKAKNPVHAPCPAMKRWAFSRSRRFTCK